MSGNGAPIDLANTHFQQNQELGNVWLLRMRQIYLEAAAFVRLQFMFEAQIDTPFMRRITARTTLALDLLVQLNPLSLSRCLFFTVHQLKKSLTSEFGHVVL